MPKIFRTLSGYLVMLHTRDHGKAHVHVYWGTPRSYQAMAKVLIPSLEVLENDGFDSSDIADIKRELEPFAKQLKERWDVIHSKKS